MDFVGSDHFRARSVGELPYVLEALPGVSIGMRLHAAQVLAGVLLAISHQQARILPLVLHQS